MKKLFYLAAALFAVACSTETTDDGPAQKVDGVRVSPAEVTMSRKGGSAEVMISTTNGDWTLTADDEEATWLQVSETEGEDGAIVTLTAEKNDTYEERVATYTVEQGTAKTTLTVSQKGKADPGLGDYIEIAPETETVAAAGNKVQVIVTSTDDWTLEAEETYDWVSCDKNGGEDGDVVLFTVKENPTEEERVAVFTFHNGEGEAKFTLTQEGQPKTYLTLTSDEETGVKTVGGNVTATFDTSYAYRELKVEVTEGDEWFSLTVAQGDSNGKNAVLNFNAAANETTEDRTATVTVTTPDDRYTSTLTFTQFRKPVIKAEKSIYTIDPKGGDITIPLECNVEYEAEVEEAAQSWLSVKSHSLEEIVLTVAEGEESVQGDITLTHSSELGGELKLELSVLRKAPSLIEYVPDWTKQRAWPGDPSWTNSQVFGGTTGLTTWSCEALVKMDDLKTKGSLSTIFGIEGHFLIRYGDASVDPDCLQLVMPGSSYSSGSTNYFGLSTSRIPTKTWVHVAITYSNMSLKLYYDGEEVATATTRYNYPVRFAYTSHNNESGNYITRCFWVSYAYDENRYWPGQMCELRIWNKVLTKEEINEPNHFYTIENPEANQNLIAYWKCNENNNSGTFKDYSGNGNDLKYDTSKPFTWVPVALGTVEY